MNPSGELGVADAELGNLLLGGPINPAQCYHDAVLQDGAIAYWRLNEAGVNGSTLADSTTNTHKGVYAGGSNSSSVAGALCGCDAGDTAIQWGTNDFAIVRDSDGNYSGNPTLNLQTGSWECWIYPLAYPSAGLNSACLENGTSSGNAGYFIDIDSSGNVLGGVRVSGAYYFVTAASAPLNQWTYVVCTYDGSTVTLYINGVLVGTVSISGVIEHAFTQLTLGTSAIAPGTQQNFVGQQDESAVYNIVLSSTQVLNHWQLGRCMKGLRQLAMIGVGL